ncbi:MAG: hypothetical protein Q9207_003650 [Kuettlingeria erythrocarpa]
MSTKLPRTPLFSALFKPGVYSASFAMQCVLHDVTHVLRPLTESRLRSRPKNGLWLRISANQIVANVTVRRWAKRRVREAVREELKVRGLGLDGLGLDGKREQLKGTMEVTVRQPAIGAAWADVQADVGRMMKAAVYMAAPKTGKKTRKNKAAA